MRWTYLALTIVAGIVSIQANATQIPRLTAPKMTFNEAYQEGTVSVSYYDNPGLEKMPLPVLLGSSSTFGLLSAGYKIKGENWTMGEPWTRGMDEMNGWQVKIDTHYTRTVGKALEELYGAFQGKLSKADWYSGSFGGSIDGMCLCIGLERQQCYTTPVCTSNNPKILHCNIPASVEITHSATAAGHNSTITKNANVDCNQSGSVMLSLTNSTVNLGGGITSSLSMNVGTGGVFSVIKGNNPLTITSNLHVPSGTSPGNYQGSTTLKLEYP
ncbi:hypothetical protein [Serratia sp. 1D1416]|uniref:hypothetical protein n=1 Tax=Serratia sp. 1D1416 TaxID=2447890 RepID=UPI001013C51D|nr:hypothetical protein [Serratia sp. 1D1416]